MKKKDKMPRLERQLRLYEVICQYDIAQFSDICEVFPYNMRLLQRDLADLKEAGLVSVKYSRKGKGYFVNLQRESRMITLEMGVKPEGF